MDTYLLLRSNKQSGPYSLQQLVNVGLKPYDLVWVEGKSAAWRYPSEVAGLKEYAPVTEEQPFDRFYKKSEEKKQDENPKQEVIAQPVPQPEKIYTQPAENITLTSPKKVFVSMPERHVAKKVLQPIAPKIPAIAEEKPKIAEEKKIERTPIPVTEETEEPVLKQRPVLAKQESLYKEPTRTYNEEPTLNEKYSESLEDIKKRYTETYLSRKKRSGWTSTHTSILQVVGGAVFFCLLVVVAYRNFAGEEKTSQRTTIIQPDKRAVNTSTVKTTPVTTQPVASETNRQASKKQQSSKQVLNPPEESLVLTNKNQQKIDQPVDANEVASMDEKQVEKKAVMPKADDESKTEEVKPRTRPVNISRLVKVKANNYKQRAFGGVMNLELTIDNDSKFALDKVIVELQYLKPSEQPIKTEKIVFHSVAPNDSKTVKIPDFLRGVKISYRVIDIESSQYERQTAGL